MIELSEAQRLMIIGGALGFMVLALLIMVCKLSPFCWLHDCCPFRPHYEPMTELEEGGKVSYDSVSKTDWSPPPPYHQQLQATAPIMDEQEDLPGSVRRRTRSSSPEDETVLGPASQILIRGEIEICVFFDDLEERMLCVSIHKIPNLIFRRKEKSKIFLKIQCVKMDRGLERLKKFFHLIDREELDKNVIHEKVTTQRILGKVLDFNEKVTFPLSREEVYGHCLRIVCCLVDKYSMYTPLGEVMVALDDLKFSRDEKLTREFSVAQPEEKGEINLILNYRPTSQKLTVQPAETRQVKLIDTPPGHSDLYVQTTMMCRNMTHVKRRVEMQQAQTNLSWDEVLTFDLSPQQLAEVSLIVSVKQVIASEEQERPRELTVGKVVIALQDSSAESRTHWKEVMLKPRQYHAQWHPLK